jgi:CheY-like chemotaxis protein
MKPSDDDASAQAPELTNVPALAGRVLLAEQDADEQCLLSLLLRQAGLEVDVVDNGDAAVEAAMMRDYELVIMATRLLGMDGVAATALLTAAGCFTPVVALAANPTPQELQRCRSAGCVDVLAMPVDQQDLYSIVARHLRPPQPGLTDDELMERELQALLAEFRSTLTDRLIEIESAWQAGELELLSRLTHTLKGGAGSYGHPEITLICAEMEHALQAHETQALQQRCTELRAAVEAAVQS